MSRLILVLGMHRSGTSLVTKSLECLGVSLGDRADWSGPDNETGFHEDQDILAINEAVLKRYGARWDTPTLDMKRQAIITDLHILAKRTLAAKLQRYPLFGLKDPRMCRLLPFWIPIFRVLGCEIGAVQVWRSPFDIASSLVRRNGRTLAYWMRLDAEYTMELGRALPIKDGFPEWPIASVSYESLIGLHPDTEVRHIAKILHLPVDQGRLAWFCSEFVRHPNG